MLKKRDLYLKRLIDFQDTELVKVITGIRRCGKSSLLKLMVEHLKESGIAQDQILEMNFESMQFYRMDAEQLYQYVKEKSNDRKKNYLFFDEIQMIPNWQRTINALRVDFDCDIYITGSNAFLLSSELSTYLSGRYVEIKMLPLSFSEFIDFYGYVLKERHLPDGTVRKRLYDSNEEDYEIQDIFALYVKYGGMPVLAETGLDQEKAATILDGIYSAVVMRDILEREHQKGERGIADAGLLRKIVMFLADNIGNNTSVTTISNVLVNEGLLDQRNRKGKPGAQTIQAYIEALVNAYIFYDIKRFDIKGKDYLRTLGKYYIVDMGIRNYLLGFRDGDTGHIIENIVYFELLRRGYSVAIGKIGQQEIDFIATKTNEKIYFQVTESMTEESTRNREMAPLLKVKDNYPKQIITANTGLLQTIDGIEIVNLYDFLLAAY